jgi:type I restriction enzyme S subunit
VTINQDMKALECSTGLRPEFLLLVLQGMSSLIVAYADESAHGTKKLDTSMLGGLAITLPPPAEQDEIVTAVQQETARLDSVSAEASRAIDLLQERRTALISAAVTGKIDVRDLVEGRDLVEEPVA